VTEGHARVSAVIPRVLTRGGSLYIIVTQFFVEGIDMDDEFQFEIKYSDGKPVSIDLNNDFGGPVMALDTAHKLGLSLINKQQSDRSVQRGQAIVDAVEPYLPLPTVKLKLVRS